MTFPGLRNLPEPMFVSSPRGMQVQHEMHSISHGEIFQPDHIVLMPPPGLRTPINLEGRIDSAGVSHRYDNSLQDAGSQSAEATRPGGIAEGVPKLDSSVSQRDALWRILQAFTPPLEASKDPKTTSPVAQGYVMRSTTAVSDAANGADNAAAWWRRIRAPLCCPLSAFPVALLPYPPFKLRVDPSKPFPYKLVDGKYLTLQIISTGSLHSGIRELTPSDVAALDDYMTRCKLGPYRLGRFLAMARKIAAAQSEQTKSRLSDDIGSFCRGARKELTKLQRIQKSRMAERQELAAAGIWNERTFEKVD